jgi:hypothetical protein
VSVALRFSFFSSQANSHPELRAQMHLYHLKLPEQREYERLPGFVQKELSLNVNFQRFSSSKVDNPKTSFGWNRE